MKRGRHERIECRHRKKRIVENAGIQRRVCDRCGHVSFNYLFDVFAEEQQQLEARPNEA